MRQRQKPMESELRECLVGAGSLAAALSQVMDGIDDEMVDEDGNGVRVTDVETFEEACLLTRDIGLVIRTSDGSEFQVTIVKSR